LVVSWWWRSTEGCAHSPSLYDMLLPLAPPEVLEEKLVASPTCDGDADPGYGGDVGTTRMRPLAGAASGWAPLLRGRGGRSVMRGTR
jgi:hypothetical protein